MCRSSKATRLLWGMALACFPAAPQTSVLDQAHQLQQQAIQRIDNYAENFRKTGDTQTLLPELQQAERELGVTIQVFAIAGDAASAALSVDKAADAERMQSHWPLAKQLYDQAYQVAGRANRTDLEAKILTGRARAENLGFHDYGAGQADAQEAVRLNALSKNNKELCESLSVLADAQEHRGELTAAAETTQRELRAATELNDPKTLMYAYIDTASVSQDLGSKCDYDSALNSFASCYSALQTAETTYQRAIALATQLGYMGLANVIRTPLEVTQTKRSLIAQRENMQRKAEESKLLNPTMPRDVLVTEDFTLGGVDDTKVTALLNQAYAGAIQQAEAMGFPLTPRDMYAKGLLTKMQGQDDAALALYLRASDLLETDRQKLHDEKSRGSFLEDKIDIYYRTSMELLRRRRYAEAFNLLERSRSRAFADLLGSKPLHLENTQEQDLYAQWVAIDANTAKLQTELYGLRTETGGEDRAKKVAAREQEISRLEEQRRLLATRIAKTAPKLETLTVSQPVSLEQLQQSMRQEGYEVLYYLALDPALIVWHIGPDSVQVKNVFLPRFEMARKVAALRKTLLDPDTQFDEPMAREMFLYLIQPMLPYIHARRIVIIPHEELNYIPFQVFEDPSDHTYAGERFQFSYAPSATVLLRMKHQNNLGGGRLLAIADPDLPQAGHEVEAIARLYPKSSKVFTDPLVSESEFKANVAGFDLVHLAVHGKFDATEPLLSYLVLRASGQDDGKLTAADMFALPLARTKLVVLSACETGRVEATHANEVQGMIRSLLYAGAGNLVLSSWKVDSASTALWMETFYREAQAQPPPEAARRALLAVKTTNGFSHPYYWAPFLVVGK